MNGNHMEIAGNLASDPELKFTPTGTAVSTFSVGVTERKRTPAGDWEDSGTTWFRVIVWGAPAENVAESLTRGMRVMVSGTMRQRSYEDKAGETRYVWELTAEEIGASLRYATADVKRVGRTRPNTPDRSDPWAGVAASSERPAERPGSGAAQPADASPERPAEPATKPAEPANAAPAAKAPGTRAGSRRRAPTRSPATA